MIVVITYCLTVIILSKWSAQLHPPLAFIVVSHSQPVLLIFTSAIITTKKKEDDDEPSA